MGQFEAPVALVTAAMDDGAFADAESEDLRVRAFQRARDGGFGWFIDLMSAFPSKERPSLRISPTLIITQGVPSCFVFCNNNGKMLKMKSAKLSKWYEHQNWWKVPPPEVKFSFHSAALTGSNKRGWAKLRQMRRGSVFKGGSINTERLPDRFKQSSPHQSPETSPVHMHEIEPLSEKTLLVCREQHKEKLALGYFVGAGKVEDC